MMIIPMEYIVCPNILYISVKIKKANYWNNQRPLASQPDQWAYSFNVTCFYLTDLNP